MTFDKLIALILFIVIMLVILTACDVENKIEECLDQEYRCQPVGSAGAIHCEPV